MTPREKTVVRAVVKALRGHGAEDMDALAMNYPEGRFVSDGHKTKTRAAMLLEALTNARD